MLNKKTTWTNIEEKAREENGVNENFTLRYADLNHDEHRLLYAKYRLCNLMTGATIYGKVYL